MWLLELIANVAFALLFPAAQWFNEIEYSILVKL